MWIEQGFRAVKRGQWNWQRTRMADADRAARLWAVLAVATVWMVEIGDEGEPPEVPPVPPRSPVPRRLSLIREGLLRLFAALVSHRPVPAGRMQHHEWPPTPWESDPLTEAIMDQC